MDKYKQALAPGTTLRSKKNVYTIEKVLGQGSFGITYCASTFMKGGLGQAKVRVALKEFFAEELDVRNGDGSVSPRAVNGIAHRYAKAFQRESENLSKMDHPGIVRVLEFFEANGTFYYSMEYLSGGSLDAKVRGVGMPEAEALPLIAKIGDALSYMHGQKMIHLDLKPGNVVLQDDGSPVIIDFGLSKQYDKKGNPESSTTIGGGTPGYAPIEQANPSSGKSFQPTLDVYALGATLFKMLTGQTPPDSSSVLADGFPESELNEKEVSSATIDAIREAMRPNWKDRLQTVSSFLKLLVDDEEAKNLLTEEYFKRGNRYFHGRDVHQDYAEAVKWYRKAADRGHADSQFILGRCYEEGLGVAPDSDEAEKWYRMAAEQSRKAADQGDAQEATEVKDDRPESDAASSIPNWRKHLLPGLAGAAIGAALALCTVFCIRAFQPNAAAKYFSAATRGKASAQYKLAECYVNGRGVDTSDTEAAKWYRKAAEQGHVEAEYALGECLYTARGVKQDYDEAGKWYRKAAEQGHVGAQYAMGRCFYYGHGVDSLSREEAVKWYRKAAERGYADAQYSLGYSYQWGFGVKKDLDVAKNWYLKAAGQGNGIAQNSLGLLYEVQLKDSLEAVKWYRKAAEQGNAEAQRNLGRSYENAVGLDRDMSAAASWLLKAAEQGDLWSQYHLGDLYRRGLIGDFPDVPDSLKRDLRYQEAFKWYRAAAEQGYAPAQNCLGEAYYDGRGVVKDYSEAIKWFRQAAGKGLAEAQYNMGRVYGYGYGVKQDFAEAFKWYSESAKKGNASAMDKLGWYYEHGYGVDQNYAEAKKWYEMALNGGHKSAQKDLDRLADMMK